MSADKKEAVPATQRVQFEMTQTSFDDLKWAKEKLGAVSYAEVMRRILRVFRYIYDGSGRRFPRFYIQDEDGGITEIFFDQLHYLQFLRPLTSVKGLLNFE